MSHLTNEINQLEAVLRNLRREQTQAVQRLRDATGAQQQASADRANAELEVERLKETIASLLASLETIRKLNAHADAVSSNPGTQPE